MFIGMAASCFARWMTAACLANLRKLFKLLVLICTKPLSLITKGAVQDFFGVCFNVKSNLAKGPVISFIQANLIDSTLHQFNLLLSQEETNNNSVHSTKCPTRTHSFLATGIICADCDGFSQFKKWNHWSIIGKLICLAGSTCPNTAFAIPKCACYNAHPIVIHKQAAKQTSWHLLATKDRESLLGPILRKIWKLIVMLIFWQMAQSMQ